MLKHLILIFFVSLVHVSNNKEMADHFRVYALSSVEDTDYKTIRDHSHRVKCDRCSIFPHVVKEIRTTIEGIALILLQLFIRQNDLGISKE